MSDGMTDAARAAHRIAEKFVQQHYPKLPRIRYYMHAPKEGTVIFIYEEWLYHVIELVTNRMVVSRWLAMTRGEVQQMSITDEDWQVGYYYAHHQIKKEVREQLRGGA